MTHASVNVKNRRWKRILVAQVQHPIPVPGCQALKTLWSEVREPLWYQTQRDAAAMGARNGTTPARFLPTSGSATPQGIDEGIGGAAACLSATIARMRQPTGVPPGP